MLTKKLLEVKKYKSDINPRYREIQEYKDVAENVISAYKEECTREEINERITDLETHDTFKFVRGLSKLLERQSKFMQQSEFSPTELRETVFEHGYVTNKEERKNVLKEVAKKFNTNTEQVDQDLWADQEKNEVLISKPQTSAKELLKQYNLSLTQTLLFDALELKFNASENYQEIFGYMKYLGLMYSVNKELEVTVTGPAALFKKTRKYGTKIAKLLPTIMKAKKWGISAKVETEVSNETRVYEFSLDSNKEHLFPQKTTTQSFDSEVEKDFATRINSLTQNWKIKREPTILRTNNQVMIPDFSFKRKRKQKRERKQKRKKRHKNYDLFLEVIGFWTPKYLEKKLRKLQSIETEVPMLLAVNENLNCTKEDFEEQEHVFFYGKQIPVKPVIKHLNQIEEKIIKKDLKNLKNKDIKTPTEAKDIQELAKEQGVEPKAIEQYLKNNHSGIISNGIYLPKPVLKEIKTEIDSIKDPTLSDVNPILEKYGAGQEILQKIGYTIQYKTLNQNEAKITKKKQQ
ncbi:MAG: Nuclease of restriction endonuclease-like fold implicated in nucleotide excision repair [Candidatus Methanohalarchaeum thermophilum]|uniref:Nuclease of restriction endonuclease-like fold implicated in nucleotide excision repair n=1 Tax=Methanohalarchaeum thermophilum TaxID=1903181 RepID=A0A1Q6DSN1_METT1|nr:MAG: Nuclease of restriction endonuclease-like fold implicated in nucleotide excision repair [Candidatus Methanohalarchaeum thermophilum]